MTELADLFEAQHRLQVQSFGLDPLELEGEERARFILWNAYALEDELHELTGEVGWKPWATSRHVHHGPAMREGVDLLHFFMNIMMAVAPRGVTPGWVAAEAAGEYARKNAANAVRQQEGYDGVTGKCPACKRDESEAERFPNGALVCACGRVLRSSRDVGTQP